MFGRPMRLHPAFDQAEVILSLDHDFLVSDPVSVRYAFDWAQGRQIRNDQMSRLYVAESLFSPTGGVADHRLAIPASEIPGFTAEVAAALLGAGVTSPALDASASLRTAAQNGKNAAFAKQAAADLASHRGRCLVVAGPRQPAAVHVLALALNEALGNIGTTLQITNDPDPDRPTHAAAIRDLTASLGNGEIETLVILGGNPVYNAPADLAFADRMGRAGRTIHLTLHPNETSSRCSWVLPRAHYLECWGDARAHEGTISVAQPLIRPLYDGRSALEMVATLLGDRHSGYELVRETHAQLGAAGEGFERAWRDILHEGLIPATSLPAEAVAFDPSRAAEAIRALSPAGSTDLEVVFAADPCTYDGRFANNGWLQELPDTVTKVTWDNIAQIAPSTAAQLDLATGDMIRIEKDGRAIEVPAWITPGHAPRSITLSMGYGRTVSGHVGTGVGFDVYPLRASTAPHVQSGVSVSKTGRSYVFATTQDHFPINSKGEEGVQTRLHQLVREASLAEVVGSTAGAHGARSSHGAEAGHEAAGTHGAEAGHGAASVHGAEHPPVIPLWDEHQYEGNKWGMAIDLTACTGCNSCVVACQSENNIPVVGRDQVRRGREMHWIRIDRYFSGTPDDPQLVLQPVTCHHCENAPCEQVCPVAATTHSREGLNDMTYNRCIGTRYCSNNCPYKVRRFNFYAYNHELGMTERMVKNPDVTVRSRGVMEKCTFCIQRIAAVRITSKNEKRPIRDGEITPACAQACPTRAIVFGDLNDPNSRVRRMHDDSRAYGMLDFELYTKPRLHYLTRVRNPHPALASSVGEGSGEEHHG
jgi:Fe-S-cluster-containing dehydrogenase component